MYNPIKPYKHQTLKLIESTWKTPYVEVRKGVYPLIREKISYPVVDHTDGIGTKGLYHWKLGTLKNAVLDALAMNLNDLALVRAVPYKMSNHIVVPLEDVRVYKILKAMARECRKRKIAMVGGETSFHNNLDSLDISMTISGFVKNPKPNECRVGDVLIGLKSSGLHSNGFTTVRRVFGTEVRKEFTKPTKIYLDEMLKLLKTCEVNGMMHITGGGFTKLKDILKDANAVINHTKVLQPQSIFMEMFAKGVTNKKMYSTFNCGIGFVLSVPKGEVKNVLAKMKGSSVIGEVVQGKGMVEIKSAFNEKQIIF